MRLCLLSDREILSHAGDDGFWWRLGGGGRGRDVWSEGEGGGGEWGKVGKGTEGARAGEHTE